MVRSVTLPSKLGKLTKKKKLRAKNQHKIPIIWYKIQAGRRPHKTLKFISTLEKQIQFTMFFYYSHKKMLYIM